MSITEKRAEYQQIGFNFKSSAMNLFTGRITEIKDIGISKKVVIDCGFDLISFVTQNSVDRLDLAVGKKIYAGVKASSIHMFNN